MSEQSKADKAKLSRKKYEHARVKVTLRFTALDMQNVLAFAGKAGKPVATYIHDVALNPAFKITPAAPRINVETRALIQRIGINFNQMTRAMNNYYEQKNFDKILLELNEIASSLRQILDKI